MKIRAITINAATLTVEKTHRANLSVLPNVPDQKVIWESPDPEDPKDFRASPDKRVKKAIQVHGVPKVTVSPDRAALPA